MSHAQTPGEHASTWLRRGGGSIQPCNDLSDPDRSIAVPHTMGPGLLDCERISKIGCRVRKRQVSKVVIAAQP